MSGAKKLASAANAQLSLTAVPADQVESGSPETGILELPDFAGMSIGVWEHTEGVSTDTEVDEVFIVISGGATIAFIDEDTPPLEVKPGDIVRLEAGAKTRWIVRDHLRKVYLIPTRP